MIKPGLYSAADRAYGHALRRVMDSGRPCEDRTGVGTRSLFGMQMRFNLSDGFPLLTSKKVHWHSIVHELIWFLRGDTNVKYLQDNGVRIWNEWADENGDLGPVYGKQWRNFGGVDQIANLIEQLRTNPESRRHIVSAWNPADVDDMALPPCHTLFQLHSAPMTEFERTSYASAFMQKEMEQAKTCSMAPAVGCLSTVCDKLDIPKRKLSLQLYQRSADMFLGVPFNIASYSLLLCVIAKLTGHAVGDFVHTLGDAHVYNNHVDQAFLQLHRIESGQCEASPGLRFTRDFDTIERLSADDIELVNYKPLPAIKAKVAV